MSSQTSRDMDNEKMLTKQYPRKDKKNNLHFKGARSGEASYVISGISASPESRIKENEFTANFHNTEEYTKIIENEFKTVKGNPLSTLSIDVDNASYSNIRRFINSNQMPYKDAVRIEEMINYFSYDYKEPQNNQPFSINTEISKCPWNKKNRLIHIGLQGKRLDQGKEPKSNLVFLLDVSGSMNNSNKLPLLKKSFKILVNSLASDDRVAIVVYAGAAGIVLPSTEVRNSEKIFAAIKNLRAGGSTAGGAGIKLAIKLQRKI